MENTPSPRKPWIALLLSIAQPTLGQIYNGQVAKGLCFALLSVLALPICGYFRLFNNFSSMLVVVTPAMALWIYLIVDSYATAKKLRGFVPTRWNRWYIYVVFSIVMQLVGEAERSLVTSYSRAFKIPSSAMSHTLESGDDIVADMRAYQNASPSRGDVIIFAYPKDPTKDFVKRVIGLPGETIAIQEKQVYINGQRFTEPAGVHSDSVIHPWDNPKGYNFGPATIPDDAYFVLGDNRDYSLDSRFWGFVRREALKGKAIYIYWSSDKTRIGTLVK